MLGFWSNGFWSKWMHRSENGWFRPLVGTYQALSSASVDDLWQKVINLADVSWHPIISSTNVPQGLIPKPGLIYRAFTRLSPIPIRVFVERVSPRELLSVRILALPGIEERVTYRIESTLCGTRISYSVTLKGWLSPLIWSVLQPYAARVAAELAQAAEAESSGLGADCRLPTAKQKRRSLPRDVLGLVLLTISLGRPILYSVMLKYH